MSQHSSESKKQENKSFSSFKLRADTPFSSDKLPSFGSLPPNTLFATATSNLNVEKSAELTEQTRKFTGSTFNNLPTSPAALEKKSNTGATFGSSYFNADGSTMLGMTAAAVKKPPPVDSASRLGSSSAFNAPSSKQSDQLSPAYSDKNTFGSSTSLFPTAQSDGKRGDLTENPKRDAFQTSTLFQPAPTLGNTTSFGELNKSSFGNSASLTGKSAFSMTKSEAQPDTPAAQQELAQKSSFFDHTKLNKPASTPAVFGSSSFEDKTSSNPLQIPSKDNKQSRASAFDGFAKSTTGFTGESSSSTAAPFGGFQTGLVGDSAPSQKPTESKNQPQFGELKTSLFYPSSLGQRRSSNGRKKSVTFSVPLTSENSETPNKPVSSVTFDSSAATTATAFSFPIQEKSYTVTASNTDSSKLTSSPFTFEKPAITEANKEPAATTGFSFSTPKILDIASSTSVASPFSLDKAATTINKEPTATGFEFSSQDKADTNTKSAPPSPFTFGTTAVTSKEQSTTSFSFAKPPETLSNTLLGSTNPLQTPSASFFSSSIKKPTETTTTATTTSSSSSASSSNPIISLGSLSSSTKSNKPGSSQSVSAPLLFVNSLSSPSSGTTAPLLSLALPVTSSSSTTFLPLSSTSTTLHPLSLSSTLGSTQQVPSTSANTTNPPFPTLHFEDKNPFSFSTILDNLIKNLNISANQIEPLLLQTVQRYETIPTTFRINDITSNTKFTELPQEAQQMLMQLETHIHGERQRSDSISAKLDTMQNKLEQVKVDTLTEQVETVNYRLKSQCHEIEKMIEMTQYQLGHAGIGIQNIIHTTNRWVFGYARSDDYFIRLSQELSERLEEYKKYIWEMERMSESWEHAAVTSPKDIGKIMEAQNKVFFRLAAKTAALHDTIEGLRRP